MLDLIQLRSFLEVAERGTVSAAAIALGYTAPAVTQHLAKLERWIGADLFDRVGGRLVVNDAGEALRPVAAEMITLAEHAADVVHRPPPHQLRIVIAGLASALSAFVVSRLAQLRELADVMAIEAEDSDALRELRLGHVDVALIQEYAGDEKHRDRRFAYRVAGTDELRLVLPPAFSRRTKLRQLRDLAWLVNGTGTRCETATRRILEAAKLDVAIAADVSDNHLLLQLVARGHGATIVPDLVLAQSDAQVTVASERLGVARTLLAVTRRRPSTPASTALGVLFANSASSKIEDP